MPIGLSQPQGVAPPTGALRQGHPSVLSRALHNFFRWNGAPWFRDRTPDAAETAASLHRAFLRRSVRRTHLVPIDRLSLEHRSDGRTQDVTSIRFGPNEIVRLHRDDLARRVPVDALARFGRGTSSRPPSSTASAGSPPPGPSRPVPSRDGPGSACSTPPWSSSTPSSSSVPPTRCRWKTRSSSCC